MIAWSSERTVFSLTYLSFWQSLLLTFMFWYYHSLCFHGLYNNAKPKYGNNKLVLETAKLGETSRTYWGISLKCRENRSSASIRMRTWRRGHIIRSLTSLNNALWLDGGGDVIFLEEKKYNSSFSTANKHKQKLKTVISRGNISRELQVMCFISFNGNTLYIVIVLCRNPNNIALILRQIAVETQLTSESGFDSHVHPHAELCEGRSRTHLRKISRLLVSLSRSWSLDLQMKGPRRGMTGWDSTSRCLNIHSLVQNLFTRAQIAFQLLMIRSCHLCRERRSYHPSHAWRSLARPSQ